MNDPAPKPIRLSSLPDGPAPGTRLVAVAELSERRAFVAEFGKPGAPFRVFIQLLGGQVRAYENRCPHAHTPLDLVPGKILDGAELVCATHGARFAFADGACLSGPCKGAWLVPVWVSVVGDWVCEGPPPENVPRKSLGNSSGTQDPAP